MGASASKASRAATGAAARKYPTRPSPQATSPAPSASPSNPPPVATPVGPSVHPPPQAHTSRSAAVDHDASDPDFARSLRSLGPVQPNPTLSPSSAFPSAPGGPLAAAAARGPDPRANPALMILEARARLADAAAREEEDFATIGGRAAGRGFLDVGTIRKVLELRDAAGKSEVEIEKSLGLKTGVVARLGAKGTVAVPDEVGRATREVEIV